MELWRVRQRNHWRSRNSHSSFSQHFLSRRNEGSSSGDEEDILLNTKTKLTWAIEKGDKEEMERLLASGVDVNEVSYHYGHSEPPIVTIIRARKYDLLPYFLAYSPDVNMASDRGYTALIRAAQRDCIGSLRLLLEHSADPNLQDKCKQTAMFWSIKHQNMDAVRELLKHGADVNLSTQQGLSVLHIAASTGNIEMAELLMLNNADVNSYDDFGDTPLFCAIRVNNFDMADTLVKFGAVVNVKNVDSQTPLHIAAASVHNSIDITILLLEKGSLVNVQDRYGSSPLVLSLRNFILRPTCSIAKCLIQHGCRLNEVETTTALEWAVLTNTNVDLLKLAVDAGLRLADVPWAVELLSDGYKKWNSSAEKKKLTEEVCRHLSGRLKNAPSLFDICRVAIRDHLIDVANGTSIYYKIQKLPLPQIIWMQLLLED